MCKIEDNSNQLKWKVLSLDKNRHAEVPSVCFVLKGPDSELVDMHKRIMQKCAPIIDEFSALSIFEVSYVEHKLKEFKNAFRKDYERNHQYVKFFKRVNKQGKTEGNADVNAKGGSKGRKKK